VRRVGWLALVGLASLVFAACAGGGGGGGEGIKGCFVTDLQGVDDRSFNAAGWKGVTDAAEAGYIQNDPGPPTNPLLLESSTRDDYQPNIDACIDAGATHIVTNGFELGPTTQTNAEANTDLKFTIVDFAFNSGEPDFAPVDIDNVRELVYQTDEAAFAAGYLAAGVTQTGIIGTYGGLNIPTVSIFMDGLTRGVAHYNQVKGTDIRVIGWSQRQEGSFTGSFDPTDPAVVSTCQSLLDEGADIILPVGGIINLPCGTEIQTRGVEAALIGVDVDAFVAMPSEFQDLWLTTITKALSSQVTLSLQNDSEGSWTNGNYVGNLANDGVGLSEYHSWADRVPDELNTEVQQLLEDIKNGKIDASFFQVG
jgi:basic membrane protein A